MKWKSKNWRKPLQREGNTSTVTLESIAKKLGINLDNVYGEYNLLVITTCRRCKAITRQYFFMQREGTALKSIPCKGIPVKYKEMSKEMYACKQCKKVMLEWSKEELVDYIMKG